MKNQGIKEKTIPKNITERMMQDRLVRTEITRESHFFFFHFYLAHYVTCETADFQREMFSLTENESVQNMIIVAFRGSAKSTIMTVSYPIWAILGKQKKKFVLILCQTMLQARRHMANLRQELESNDLLKNDLGPFKEDSNEWGMFSIVFSQCNARISVASSEQSIRGLRHAQYRPDLIIGDDLEDLNSTRTLESRDKTYQWLTGDVIPAGDPNTRLILIGNLLHEDSLLMRCKNAIEEGSFDGIFKKYPLLNEQTGKCLWQGKYPDQKSLLKQKRKTGSEFAWQREYLLRIVRDTDQVIRPEWIHFYESLPNRNQHRAVIIGIDLAISQKSTADYTAIVSAIIVPKNEQSFLYILPNPVNTRMDFPTTRMHARDLYDTLKLSSHEPTFYIESVGYQDSLIQILSQDGYQAEGIKVTADKRSRLALAGPPLESGKILFPKKGCELLLQQILHFGVEKYDDLADAFSLTVDVFIRESERGVPRIRIL